MGCSCTEQVVRLDMLSSLAHLDCCTLGYGIGAAAADTVLAACELAHSHITHRCTDPGAPAKARTRRYTFGTPSNTRSRQRHVGLHSSAVCGMVTVPLNDNWGVGASWCRPVAGGGPASGHPAPPQHARPSHPAQPLCWHQHAPPPRPLHIPHCLQGAYRLNMYMAAACNKWGAQHALLPKLSIMPDCLQVASMLAQTQRLLATVLTTQYGTVAWFGQMHTMQ